MKSVTNPILATQKMKKSKPLNRFPSTMYNNVYGSVLVCYFILNKVPKYHKEELRVIKQWKMVEKDPDAYINFLPNDPAFIEKTFRLFGLDLSKLAGMYPYMCRVTSKFGQLYAPYVDEKVLPLREDGFVGYTLKTGQIDFPWTQESTSNID